MADSSEDSDSDDIHPPAIPEMHLKLYEGPVSMVNLEMSTAVAIWKGSGRNEFHR